MQIKAGQLIVLTSDSYSGYHIRNYVKALQNFKTSELFRRFLQERNLYLLIFSIETEFVEEYDLFRSWLVHKGYVESVEVFGWSI